MRAWAAAPEIVADIARREFGVRYHADHIGRALRTLGGSPRKPERLAREADEAAIQRRVKVEWPRIKKSAAPECQPGVRWHTSTCYSLHDDGRIA